MPHLYQLTQAAASPVLRAASRDGTPAKKEELRNAGANVSAASRKEGKRGCVAPHCHLRGTRSKRSWPIYHWKGAFLIAVVLSHACTPTGPQCQRPGA